MPTFWTSTWRLPPHTCMRMWRPLMCWIDFLRVVSSTNPICWLHTTLMEPLRSAFCHLLQARLRKTLTELLLLQARPLKRAPLRLRSRIKTMAKRHPFKVICLTMSFPSTMCKTVTRSVSLAHLHCAPVPWSRLRPVCKRAARIATCCGLLRKPSRKPSRECLSRKSPSMTLLSRAVKVVNHHRNKRFAFCLTRAPWTWSLLSARSSRKVSWAASIPPWLRILPMRATWRLPSTRLARLRCLFQMVPAPTLPRRSAATYSTLSTWKLCKTTATMVLLLEEVELYPATTRLQLASFPRVSTREAVVWMHPFFRWSTQSSATLHLPRMWVLCTAPSRTVSRTMPMWWTSWRVPTKTHHAPLSRDSTWSTRSTRSNSAA